MRLDLLYIIEDLDSISTVCRLTRFEDPELARLECGFEGLKLHVQFKLRLCRDQISLRHVIGDIQTLVYVVTTHALEETRLLSDNIDAIQVVVDLVAQEFFQNARSTYLSPD